MLRLYFSISNYQQPPFMSNPLSKYRHPFRSNKLLINEGMTLIDNRRKKRTMAAVCSTVSTLAWEWKINICSEITLSSLINAMKKYQKEICFYPQWLARWRRECRQCQGVQTVSGIWGFRRSSTVTSPDTIHTHPSLLFGHQNPPPLKVGL